MAIACELIGCNGDELVLPPLFKSALAAAGVIDIAVDCELLIFRNFTTSQTVHIRMRLDPDTIDAAAGDSTSIKVEAGETIRFKPPAGDASAYELSVQ